MDRSLEVLLARPGAHDRATLNRRFGRRAVDAAERAGLLSRLSRGLCCGSLHADSPWTRASALLLAGGDACSVSGRAALFLRHAVLDAPSRVTIAAPTGLRVRREVPGTRLLRTVYDVPSTSIHGMAVAAAENALLHAMAEAAPERARATALEALSTGVIDIGLVDDLCTSRRFRGRPILRESLAAYGVGVRSILEYRGLTDVFVGTEFADLLRQHTVTVAGRRFVIDAYDPVHRIAFELDGEAFHTSPRQWQHDRERDTLIASAGILTVRFTYADVTHRPLWCRELAQRIIAVRARTDQPVEPRAEIVAEVTDLKFAPRGRDRHNVARDA